MSLHQIWPRLEEPSPETLSPLQVSCKQQAASSKQQAASGKQRVNVAIIVIEIMQCALHS